MRTQQEGGHLLERAHKKHSSGTLIMDSQPLELRENKCLLLKPQPVVSCYGSLS